MPTLPFARNNDQPLPSSVALLVMDVQRAFTDTRFHTQLPRSDAAIENLVTLIQGAREAGIPVAFTRHVHPNPPPPGGMGSWWKTFLLEFSEEAELEPRVMPRSTEPVFDKSTYSAFFETELQAWLASRGCRAVLLAGFMTHICVDTSAREAFVRGYDVLVAHDSCASKNDDLHEASLLCLSHAVARVVSTEQLVSSFRAGHR